MSTYIFKKLRDEENRFDISSVVFKVESETLPEIVEEFERFLKASGFTFDWSLELHVKSADKDSDDLDEVEDYLK